jgi:hypothetical protein
MRRIKKEHVWMNRMCYIMCLQAFMAVQNDEIDEKTMNALFTVFQRSQKYVQADAGIYERAWQRRYDALFKINWNAEWILTTVVFLGYALAATIAIFVLVTM